MAGLESWECNGTTPNGELHDNQCPQGPHEPQLNFGKTCAFCGLTKEQVQKPSRGSRALPPKTIATFGILLTLLGASTVILPSFLAKRGSPPNESQPTQLPPVSQNITWFNMAGSNTIGRSLAPRLVEAFMKSEGCSNIKQTISKISDEGKDHDVISITCQIKSESYGVTIRPWGSNYGLKFLLGNRSADIAMMSRQIGAKDIAKYPAASDLRSRDNEHVIALDAIAIIANQQGSNNSVSIPDLRRIFSTGLDDGGKQYTLYSRDSKSGTFDTFESLVMNKQPISSEATFFEDSKQLVNGVASRPGALGYVSLAAAEGEAVSILPVKSVSDSAVFKPNRFTIKSEDYPLTRRLFLYINKATSSQKVSKFIEFVIGEEGQKVVDANDFVSQELLADKSEENASTCASLVSGSEALSTKFRFETGSNILDSKAVADIYRLKDYLVSRNINLSRVVLLGFADSVGSEQANKVLSEQRAFEVSRQLGRAGLKISNVKGLGSSNPVASNETEDGKTKNRRVEVCVKP
jgi:phosphate transport system substrate-binding protein